MTVIQSENQKLIKRVYSCVENKLPSYVEVRERRNFHNHKFNLNLWDFQDRELGTGGQVVNLKPDLQY